MEGGCMELKEKYQPVLSLGEQLGVKDRGFKEEGGKIKMWGLANYQYDKNRIWDKIKTIPGWENEVAADIKVANEDIYGVYTVESGDTLSKLAKVFLGNPNAYMEIFNLNKDQLTDPNKIGVGQRLKIPKQKGV
jgi:LysM repeat protein